MTIYRFSTSFNAKASIHGIVSLCIVVTYDAYKAFWVFCCCFFHAMLLLRRYIAMLLQIVWIIAMLHTNILDNFWWHFRLHNSTQLFWYYVRVGCCCDAIATLYKVCDDVLWCITNSEKGYKLYNLYVGCMIKNFFLCLLVIGTSPSCPFFWL